jgi:2-(1,2-epoxy-1,2-dihydrophenyl)acetyl-CoA isomerase
VDDETGGVVGHDDIVTADTNESITEYSGFRASRSAAGIMTITFDRPARLNAMTQGLKRDLIELLTTVQMDDDVHVVIFTGSGGAFCAGDDLGAYHEDDPTTVARIGPGHNSEIGTVTALRVYSQALTLAVRNLDKITIAALNGAAVQTGLSLALACDFRIASHNAKLGSATLRFGLLPDEGGHYLLLQHLGLARTIDVLLRAKFVSAAEALDLGLVTEVTEPADLMPQAHALATELAAGPQVAMRLLKRAIYAAAETDFMTSMNDIALRTGIVDHHPDAREGAASFAEKRAPQFNKAPTRPQH